MLHSSRLIQPADALSSRLSQALQLVSAVLGPPLSRIGDYYGRKWIVVVCLLFGAAGNFIIASANSMEVAIAGSAIHGVLYAAQVRTNNISGPDAASSVMNSKMLVFLQGNTFAIASEVVPRRWRGVAQVINNYGGNSGEEGYLSFRQTSKLSMLLNSTRCTSWCYCRNRPRSA